MGVATGDMPSRAASLPPEDERIRAARFVSRHARDKDDEAQLLDALGLVADKPQRRPGRPRGPEHGEGGYGRGCRCRACRDANAAYEQARITRKADTPAGRVPHTTPHRDQPAQEG